MLPCLCSCCRCRRCSLALMLNGCWHCWHVLRGAQHEQLSLPSRAQAATSQHGVGQPLMAIRS
jgi:hypothetical protein